MIVAPSGGFRIRRHWRAFLLYDPSTLQLLLILSLITKPVREQLWVRVGEWSKHVFLVSLGETNGLLVLQQLIIKTVVNSRLQLTVFDESCVKYRINLYNIVLVLWLKLAYLQIPGMTWSWKLIKLFQSSDVWKFVTDRVLTTSYTDRELNIFGCCSSLQHKNNFRLSLRGLRTFILFLSWLSFILLILISS